MVPDGTIEGDNTAPPGASELQLHQVFTQGGLRKDGPGHVQPDRVWLRAHPSARVTALQVGQWFDDVLALAAGVEGIGGG